MGQAANRYGMGQKQGKEAFVEGGRGRGRMNRYGRGQEDGSFFVEGGGKRQQLLVR